MARTPGTKAADHSDPLQTHNNLVTVDKNMYMRGADRGTMSTKSHPFRYNRPNANTDGPNFPSSPGNGLTTEAVSGVTVKWVQIQTDMAWMHVPEDCL